MEEKQQDTTFRLVFDGRLVAGRNAIEVEAAFTKRFGNKAARTVFAGSAIALKAGLSRDQAVQLQRVFEEIGMVVQAIPSTPQTADLSLAERPQPEPGPKPATSLPSSAEAPSPPDFGVLPEPPASLQAPKPTSDMYTREELAAAFKNAAQIPPADRSYIYKLIPVTLIMLLLPLIYLGIATLSVYLVYFIATAGWAWFDGSLSVLRLFGFGASLLAAILLTLFLARPLLARKIEGPQPIRLERSREPVLFELVEHITDAIGAPMPHEILVDTNANASARLTHGAFSKDLTLTVGLPLVYGLNLQTLTGILAHEFGHFTQTWGMRSMYVVHQINYWFYRQVHENDSWDEFLESMAEKELAILSLAAVLAQLGSVVVQLLLTALSYLAGLFSFSLSRQMEFDADRYEIGLVGSAAYENTAASLRLLIAGHQQGMNDLFMALDGDKLTDNLPKLAANNAARFSAADRQEIMTSFDEINTSVFDTHPTDHARIRKALEADVPAQFEHTGPAARLLREPERLSKLATLQWYRSIGVDANPDDLQPLDEFDSGSDLLKRAELSIMEYCGDLDRLPQHLPLMMHSTLQKKDDQQLLAELAAAKNNLHERKTAFLSLRDKFDEAVEYQYYYRQALFWRRAGFDFDLNAYRLPLTTADVGEITAKLAGLKETENQNRAALMRCAELQGERLSLGLELAVRRSNLERAEFEALRRAYAALTATADTIARIDESGERLDLLLQISANAQDDPKYERQARSELSTFEQLLRQLRTGIGSVADPFSQGGTLADSLPNEYAGDGNRIAAAALDDAGRMVRQIHRMIYKLLGRMAEIALATERGLIGEANQRQPG